MATYFNHPVRLSLEVGQSGPEAPREFIEPSVSSAPADEASAWQDAAEPEAPKRQALGGLSKAQKILGGTVRIVKKPGA